jgi:hypothetical protein
MEELDSPAGGASADCDTYDMSQLMEWDETRINMFGSQNLADDNLTEGEEEEEEARGEPPKKRAVVIESKKAGYSTINV